MALTSTAPSACRSPRRLPPAASSVSQLLHTPSTIAIAIAIASEVLRTDALANPKLYPACKSLSRNDNCNARCREFIIFLTRTRTNVHTPRQPWSGTSWQLWSAWPQPWQQAPRPAARRGRSGCQGAGASAYASPRTTNRARLTLMWERSSPVCRRRASPLAAPRPSSFALSCLRVYRYDVCEGTLASRVEPDIRALKFKK